MTPKITLPTLNDIQQAAITIRPYVHNTPVLSSSIINNIAQCTLFFKCENFQKAGAFKSRGATNALLQLKQQQITKPVTTHSSGNHAGALAKAAQTLGFECIVVMPSNAPKVKIAAVKQYGAQIRFCEPSLEAREQTTHKVMLETDAVLVHPYDNFDIIAGQGTAALELLETQPNIELVITPVGGGGLLSGSAIAAKSVKPSITVVAAEPQGADDAYRSLLAGKIIPSINPNTIADGLLTSLGERNFAAIQQHVDSILTVSDDGIRKAMKMIWQYMKIIVEPSSAITLAAILEHPEVFRNKKVGAILTGGNVDLEKLPFKATQ